MKATPVAITDVFLVGPQVYGDVRGFFFESFNQTKFEQAIGKSVSSVPDSHSKSVKGVLRGLHYQLPPMAQGKLVRVVQDEVFDVAVGIRNGSPTFGKWVFEVLFGENKRQLWIPEGFAHGFVTLSDSVEFKNKTTNYYSQSHERAIRWDDEALAIDWPEAGTFQLSAKDKEAATLDQAEVFV